MIQTYKYKSKIATAIAFIAGYIMYLGKDGLTEIIPIEYQFLIPSIIFCAAYVLAQKTEDKRVDVAEQIMLEKFGKLMPTEDVDPANEYENEEYPIVGDAEDGC